MTTYKDIRGTHITTVTTDPPAPVNGQMWYNSTEQVMKGFTSIAAGSWATTGTLNTGRAQTAGSGIQTAALITAGGTPALGGFVTRNESYNGTSFTEVGDANTARQQLAGGGASNTANIIYGGIKSGPALSADTETWNGSSWTEVADLNTARQATAVGGTYTSAVATDGSPGGVTESWNGSSWTEITDLNTARAGGSTGGSSNTDVLFAGGSSPAPAVVGNTEIWDGSSWTEVADMNASRKSLQGQSIGTTSSSLNAGGEPSFTTAAEEFTRPATTTVTFTAS